MYSIQVLVASLFIGILLGSIGYIINSKTISKGEKWSITIIIFICLFITSIEYNNVISTSSHVETYSKIYNDTITMDTLSYYSNGNRYNTTSYRKISLYKNNPSNMCLNTYNDLNIYGSVIRTYNDLTICK